MAIFFYPPCVCMLYVTQVIGDLFTIKAPVNDRKVSFSERKSERKSMSGVNSGWQLPVESSFISK